MDLLCSECLGGRVERQFDEVERRVATFLYHKQQVFMYEICELLGSATSDNNPTRIVWGLSAAGYPSIGEIAFHPTGLGYLKGVAQIARNVRRAVPDTKLKNKTRLLPVVRRYCDLFSHSGPNVDYRNPT